MPTVLTGNPASGAWSPAVSATCPADLDLANAASVNSAFQSTLNAIAFLQANAAQKGNSNTWTAAQTLQALLTLTASGNALALAAAVAQSILKTAAGGLTVGTAAGAGDLTLSANGVALLYLKSAGYLSTGGKVLTDLPTPTAAQEAATKGYVDGKFPALSWTVPTINTAGGWTNQGGVYALQYWKDSGGVVHLRGGATAGGALAGLVATLPAGFQTTADFAFPIVKETAGARSLVVARLGVANGQLLIDPTPVAGSIYWFGGVSFVAEQ